LRLFGCACCRRIWSLLPSDLNREAVLAVEESPDGSFDDPVLHEALVASSSVGPDHGDNPAYWAVKYLGRSYYKLTPWACTLVVAQKAAAKAKVEDATRNEEVAQADLVRCIFGSPFQPLPARPFPAHVIGLARACEAALPEVSDQFLVLADALDDLGEEGPAAHCRKGAHARGCHVLAWALGK
jgi:hypothetical protein